jgi:hypothetical protein
MQACEFLVKGFLLNPLRYNPFRLVCVVILYIPNKALDEEWMVVKTSQMEGRVAFIVLRLVGLHSCVTKV